jgi:hypothetical protein
VGRRRYLSEAGMIAGEWLMAKTALPLHVSSRFRSGSGRSTTKLPTTPDADRKAERTLREIAREVGFDEVTFQFEPIAAALDYERQISTEEIALIADIGGGTSDLPMGRSRQATGYQVETDPRPAPRLRLSCGCSTFATWLSTLSNRSSIRALCSGRIRKYHRHAVLNVSFAYVACRNKQVMSSTSCNVNSW